MSHKLSYDSWIMTYIMTHDWFKHQMHGEFWKRTGEHSKIYLTLILFQIGLSKMNFENSCHDDSIFIFKPVQNFLRLGSLLIWIILYDRRIRSLNEGQSGPDLNSWNKRSELSKVSNLITNWTVKNRKSMVLKKVYVLNT